MQSSRLLHQRRFELPLHRPLPLLLAKPRASGAGSRGRREAVRLGSPREGAGSRHSTMVPCCGDVLGVRPVPTCPARQKHAGELPCSRGALAPALGRSRTQVKSLGSVVPLVASGEGPGGGIPMGFWGPVTPTPPRGLFRLAAVALRAALRDRQQSSQRGLVSGDGGGCCADGGGSRQRSDSTGGVLGGWSPLRLRSRPQHPPGS